MRCAEAECSNLGRRRLRGVAGLIPFMRLMGQLRELPARIAAIPRKSAPPAPEALTSEQYRDAFLLIGEEPGAESFAG